MVLWTIWSSGKLPAHDSVIGTRSFLGSLPTQTVSQFKATCRLQVETLDMLRTWTVPINQKSQGNKHILTPLQKPIPRRIGTVVFSTNTFRFPILQHRDVLAETMASLVDHSLLRHPKVSPSPDVCFVTKSPPHLELHWDHLFFPHKWGVMTLVSLTQCPKELLSLLIEVCRGRESRPKIRTAFTAKAPPENCWFLPSSSSLKHQALAHYQLTASSEEVPLNFGCFQIWSDHVMSLDRIIWMKKFSEEEWMHQNFSYFLRTLKLSACSTALLMYLSSQAGFRYGALQRSVAEGCSRNTMETGDEQGFTTTDSS